MRARAWGRVRGSWWRERRVGFGQGRLGEEHGFRVRVRMRVRWVRVKVMKRLGVGLGFVLVRVIEIGLR